MASILPQELLDAIEDLHIVDLRFFAAVERRLELPPLPGPVLHGMLGRALARECCTCGTVRPGRASGKLPPFTAHDATCLFRQLYRPVVPGRLAEALGFGSEKEATSGAPAPHLLRPPLGRRVFTPGDRLAFTLVLVGRAATGAVARGEDEYAVASWRRVVRAVERGLGEAGLGRERVKCPLVEVSDGEGRPVWVRGYGFVDEPAVQVPARMPMPAPRGWVQLRFLTPAAVKDASTTVDAHGKHHTLSAPNPLGAVCRALLRRIYQLSVLYCQGTGGPVVRTEEVGALPYWEPPGLDDAIVSPPRSGRAALEARRAVTFPRVENHTIHAEVGELHARGVPSTFVRLCHVGQHVGIGSRTNHGLGWFEVLC